MQLSEIMSKEVFAANPLSTLSEVAQLMLRHNIGAVPICDEGDKLLGIITDRDLAVECCTSRVDVRNAHVQDFMTSCPISAFPEMDLKQACELMAHEQIRRLPIVHDGKLIGIVSLGALAVSAPAEKAVLDALARISAPSRVQRVLRERAAEGGVFIAPMEPYPPAG